MEQLPRLMRVLTLFALGLVLAYLASACGSGQVAGAVSTSGVTRTTPTRSEAAVTSEVTVTNERTVTNESTVTHASTVTNGAIIQHSAATTVTAPAPTTTAPPAAAVASDSGTTSSWIWIVVAVGLGIGVVVVIVALLRGRRYDSRLSAEERRQRLFTAVESWRAQGWAVESETGEEATLANGTERMLVKVDPAGNISTHRLAANS